MPILSTEHNPNMQISILPRELDMNEKTEKDPEMDCEITVEDGAHSTCDMPEEPESETEQKE